MPIDEIREFFDRLAPAWVDNTHEYETRERITGILALPADSVIADIGCGKGVMFEHLLKRNPRRIIGIDVSGEMLKYAAEVHADPRISYMNADVLVSPLPALDAAIIFNAYPHLLSKQALAEKLAQHVRMDGIVMIAHSVGKAQINGRHHGKASAISVPLRDASLEAREFAPYFMPDILIDNDDLYVIRLIRVQQTDTPLSGTMSG